jgi:putative transposase
LYREERLLVRRRGGRKRALGTRAPMELPRAINQRWSLDFVSDTLSDGRRFRILAIVDDFSRECLALAVDTSLGGVRVVRELERLAQDRALPRVIVSDNGTELTSIAVLSWAAGRVDCGVQNPARGRYAEQVSGSAARPLAPPPHLGQTSTDSTYGW